MTAGALSHGTTAAHRCRRTACAYTSPPARSNWPRWRASAHSSDGGGLLTRVAKQVRATLGDAPVGRLRCGARQHVHNFSRAFRKPVLRCRGTLLLIFHRTQVVAAAFASRSIGLYPESARQRKPRTKKPECSESADCSAVVANDRDTHFARESANSLNVRLRATLLRGELWGRGCCGRSWVRAANSRARDRETRRRTARPTEGIELEERRVNK